MLLSLQKAPSAWWSRGKGRGAGVKGERGLQASGPAPGGRKMAEGERQSPPGRTTPARRGSGRGVGAVPGVGAGKGCGVGGLRDGVGGGSGGGGTPVAEAAGPRRRTCWGDLGAGKDPWKRRGGRWGATPELGDPEGRVGSAVAKRGGLFHIWAARAEVSS